MDKAVADSSVLIHLAAIGRLNLLPQLYAEILIPDAVWHEVVTQGRSRPVVDQVERAEQDGWLRRHHVANHALETALRHELHAGEAAAICLALECQADVLLVDEAEARQLAAQHGLRTTGIVGVLFRAKQAGYVDCIKPCLTALTESGFYLAAPFVQRILQEAGED